MREPLARYHAASSYARAANVKCTVMPTTSGTGSEVTPYVSLQTAEHKKRTLTDRALFPDLALVDPRETWTVRAGDSQSTQGYTPFEGIELSARVKATFLRGQLICEDGNVLGRPTLSRAHRAQRWRCPSRLTRPWRRPHPEAALAARRQYEPGRLPRVEPVDSICP